MATNDPFGSPQQNPYSFQETPMAQLPPELQRGLVHHLPALGIFTIIQGALVTLVGVCLIGLAALIPTFFADGGFAGRPGMPARPMPPEAEWMVMAIYGAMGLCALAVGILNIVGGVHIMRFRSRTLGIVALSCGLLSLFSCYCFPTALALFVYGLIVLTNAPVKRAFEMSAEGNLAQDIQNHFARLPVS